MTDPEQALLVAFELHAPERIQTLVDAGLDLRERIEGKAPLTWLTEMYTRSDRLPDCVRLRATAATGGGQAGTTAQRAQPLSGRRDDLGEPAPYRGRRLAGLACCLSPIESIRRWGVYPRVGTKADVEPLVTSTVLSKQRLA